MSDPVTIVVRRKVKPGRGEDYQVWLERLTRGASENFLDIWVPSSTAPLRRGGEFRSVFRFDSLEHLEVFERSGFRQDMLAGRRTCSPPTRPGNG